MNANEAHKSACASMTTNQYLNYVYDVLCALEGNPLQHRIPPHLLKGMNRLAEDIGEYLDDQALLAKERGD